MDGFSFCESDTASATSPWHIRPLTGQGQKFGGGVDTVSLCGRVEKGRGWDLEVPFTLHQIVFHHVCQKCFNAFLREAYLAGRLVFWEELPDASLFQVAPDLDITTIRISTAVPDARTELLEKIYAACAARRKR